MRMNPLNDLVHSEVDLVSTAKYFAQDEIPEDDFEEMEDIDTEEDREENMNDSIFLFLD
jgi:hypothetical protein